MRNDSRPHVHHHHHQQIKRQHETVKEHHIKALPPEPKLASSINTPKENVFASLRKTTALTDVIRLIFFLFCVLHIDIYHYSIRKNHIQFMNLVDLEHLNPVLVMIVYLKNNLYIFYFNHQR
jgi:hypothetical protein